MFTSWMRCAGHIAGSSVQVSPTSRRCTVSRPQPSWPAGRRSEMKVADIWAATASVRQNSDSG